ncbi:hypothetical protein LRP88_06483 [Fusarium phalaenopsidis]
MSWRFCNVRRAAATAAATFTITRTTTGPGQEVADPQVPHSELIASHTTPEEVPMRNSPPTKLKEEVLETREKSTPTKRNVWMSGARILTEWDTHGDDRGRSSEPHEYSDDQLLDEYLRGHERGFRQVMAAGLACGWNREQQTAYL